MKNTQLKVEDVSGDMISEETISAEQITKFRKRFSQKVVNMDFCIKI